MPELLITRGGEELMRLRVERAPSVLGRGEACDFMIPDAEVSRRHVELRADGDRIAVRDLSGRGLRAAGREVAAGGEATLGDGEALELGAFSAVVRAGGGFGAAATDAVARPGGGATTVREREPLPAGRAVLRMGDAAVPVGAAPVSVGANPTNTIVLKDAFASGFHCRVFARDGRYWVRDLGSTNGTLLDGARVIEAELASGATLRVGDAELKFVIEAPAGRDGTESGGAATELPGLFFRDPALEPVADAVRRAAPSGATVLVLGENGSGKEVVARALHALSARAKKNFVALNCGALPESLVESELFGHEKGAFTGATDRRSGAFEEADGGTLFLDEVGDLPLEQQVKLLRALESGEVKRVGGSRPQRVDVRVVAATNRDLFGAVEAGTFREDLFYRLYVVPILVPPLRQRPLDILPLADRFLEELAPVRGVAFTADARRALLRHPWPGNVRELRNTVQRGLVFRDGAQVSERALGLDLNPRVRRDGLVNPAGKTLEEIENEVIRLAHERLQGNRSAMAKELGVARSTLAARLKALGIQDE